MPGAADALPGRDVHFVADSAYAGEELKKLGTAITWTTRLRKDAALYGLPPDRTGRRGRPRVRGTRLPSLALAATAGFTQVTVTRYGKATTVQAAVVTCLWYTVFGTRHVQVVLVRDRSAAGYDLALVTTDLDACPAQVIERYAARWSIEVTIEDAKQEFGAGQAPQPHRERGPPHHPFPARLPGHRHHLVRHRRPRPRRPRRPRRPALSTCLESGCVRVCQGLAGAGRRCRGQAAAGKPMISFQVVKRSVIWPRYCGAVRRWRRGRKCGEIALKTERNC